MENYSQPGDFYKARLDPKGLDYVGQGTEKMVFKHPDNPQRVVSLFNGLTKSTPELTRGRFYLSRILELFFPENFTTLHLAASNPHHLESDFVDGMMIDPYNKSQVLQMDLLAQKIYDQTGVPLDKYYKNFIFDTTHHLHYVDNSPPWNFIRLKESNQEHSFAIQRRYSPTLIIQGIASFPETKAKKAQIYLERLEALFIEASRGKKILPNEPQTSDRQ